jgi:hypothetical protein
MHAVPVMCASLLPVMASRVGSALHAEGVEPVHRGSRAPGAIFGQAFWSTRARWGCALADGYCPSCMAQHEEVVVRLLPALLAGHVDLAGSLTGARIRVEVSGPDASHVSTLDALGRTSNAR